MRKYYNELELNDIVSRKMLGSYLWMSLGLLITTFMIMFTLYNVNIFLFVVKNYYYSFIVTILLVMGLSAAMYSINTLILKMMFIIYATFLGLILTPIIFTYELTSIIQILIASTITFIFMTVYGYLTKSNLDSYNKYLFGGLIGIIVISFLNLFVFKSNMLDTLISIGGLFIFIIYTAVDSQRIKNNIMYLYINGDEEVIEKVQIIGALNLYIDFINIFLYLLRLFGKKRN